VIFFFIPIFVRRVTPTVVTSFLSSAIEYYETSKAKYPSIAAAENNILKTVAEKIKPTITELDQFGCRQLDQIETQVNSSKKKIEETIYKPAEQALESTKIFVYNNIVNTKPINHALEITEYAVDRLLFDKKSEDEEDSPNTQENTLDVNMRLTRLRSKTMDKLKSLQPLSEEKLKSLTHSVSLIEYASKYIDKRTLEFVQAPLQEGTKLVKNGVNVLEMRVNQSVESVISPPLQRGVFCTLSSKVTQSVAKTLGKTTIITYVPRPVLEKVESNYEVIKIKIPQNEKGIEDVNNEIIVKRYHSPFDALQRE